MTETKKGFLSIGEIVGIAFFALLMVGIFVFAGQLNAAKERRQEFEAVCHYQGGTVHGDVCVKDGVVILYKKTLDLEHQD